MPLKKPKKRGKFTSVTAKSTVAGSSFTADRTQNKPVLIKVGKNSTKIGRTDNNPYANLESHTPLDIDPLSMTTGKLFDVDKQIELDKKIDPKDVFQNYKEPKQNKKVDKNKEDKKKIRRVDKKVIDKAFTIKYGI
tara:strand:- start:23 stop:430 length:408 start_codon:yes stop_codon:yes gene_type:complete